MTKEELLRSNLSAIREVLDADVTGCDESTIQEKILQLTQLSGLAAECKGNAKGLLEMARARAIIKYKDELTGNTLMALANGECHQEHALYEYADRINAGLSHNIEGLRSVLSYRKSELENSLK